MASLKNGGLGRIVFGAAALTTLLSGAALAAGFRADPRRALFAYLAAFTYVVSIVVGALFLLLISYATNARWMSVLRRALDSTALAIVPLALSFIPLALHLDRIYVWARPRVGASGELAHALAHKASYLNPTAFVDRTIAYFAVWSVCALVLRAKSVRRTGREIAASPSDALRGERSFSAVMLVPCALAITFAAFDWLMSLEPTWVSSIFGVYYFAGGFLSAIAAMTIVASLASERGALDDVITPHHFHALGRLLLGFTVFWAYAAYFQVFLISIADKPIEVTFYVTRLHGDFRPFVYLLAVGHFGLPFLLLLPRSMKFRPRALSAISVWLLAMHYADITWLVMPSYSRDHYAMRWVDGVALLFLSSAAVTFVAFMQRGQRLVALHDPFLPEGARYASTQ